MIATMRITLVTRCGAAWIAGVLTASCGRSTGQPPGPADSLQSLASEHRLPTGVRLAPVGRSVALGNMPLNAIASRDGRHLVVSLGGWRGQGIEIVDRTAGRVVQRLAQPGAFFGLAWSADNRTLYASGGTADAVYEYRWRSGDHDPAVLQDSIVLGAADGKTPGSRYPSGIAVSPNGRTLYVAEN